MSNKSNQFKLLKKVFKQSQQLEEANLNHPGQQLQLAISPRSQRRTPTSQLSLLQQNQPQAREAKMLVRMESMRNIRRKKLKKKKKKMI